MKLLIILATVFYVSYCELWQNPEYLVVSKTPMCIDATIHVTAEVIEAKGLDAAQEYYDQIITEVSRIFAWHNIKFNVPGWNFWMGDNPIQIRTNIIDTMPIYGEYLINNPDENDVHILFVNINNTATNLGRASYDGACTQRSYAVVQVGDRAHWDPIYAAIILAHEIGHLLGFDHIDANNSTCKCPWDGFKCVMQPMTYYWSKNAPTSFDSCNINKLINNPKSCLFGCDRFMIHPNPPVCGNNLLEEGEECDCGFEESCILMGRRSCCNPKTCKLTDPSYDCDEGMCCDGCKYKRGNLCKASRGECDLNDYCGGDSPFCDHDNFKVEGSKCAGGSAYCVEGSCITKDYYCESLFPYSNTSYNDVCQNFALNKAATSCSGLTNANLINLFCGSGKGPCGQVYCKGPIANDPYYSFTSGSMSCYTLLDDKLNMNKNKVPYGGVCGVNKVCSAYGECIPDDYIQYSCRIMCKEYEECNGREGNCVPNNPLWFVKYGGSPDKPQ